MWIYDSENRNIRIYICSENLKQNLNYLYIHPNLIIRIHCKDKSSSLLFIFVMGFNPSLRDISFNKNTTNKKTELNMLSF